MALEVLEKIHKGLYGLATPVRETIRKITPKWFPFPFAQKIESSMEAFEEKVAPITRKFERAGLKLMDTFIESYKVAETKNRRIWTNILDPTWKMEKEGYKFAPGEKEKFRKQAETLAQHIPTNPFVPAGGLKGIDPRVARILQKAVQKGVSGKTLKQILKIKPSQLKPLIQTAKEQAKRITKIKPPTLNLDRIQAPEEIKTRIIDWTNKHAKYLADQYPHYTFREIQSELEKSGFDILKGMRTWKKVFGGDTKKTLVAIKGIRDSALKIEQQIANIQKALRTTNNPDKILSLTTRLKDLQLAHDGLFEAVLGSGRISGQLLAFRRMTSKALKGTVLEKRLVLERLLGKQFEPGSAPYQKFITLLKNIDPADPQAVMQFLRQAQAPNITDFPASIWYNAILSGPKTHLVNLLGNTLFGTVESFVVRPIAFLLDTPLSKLRGVAPRHTSKSMVGYYGGMLRGLKIGIDRFWQTMKTGFDPEEILYPSKWQQLRQVPWETKFVRMPGKISEVPGWLQPWLRGTGKVINIPTRLLKAADTFFKGIFEEARKFELIVPKVWSKNKTLRQLILEADELARSNPLEWSDEAIQFGRWMTFQDAPGKITSWVIRGRDTVPGLRYIIPFVNIASNLLKRGFIDYSPVGLTKGIQEIVIKNPKAAETTARGLFGTLVMLGGVLKYLDGSITLGAPPNRAERDAFYRQGKQPWSVKIGDRWVGIRRLEPFIYPFLSGALIADAVHKGKLNDKNTEEIIADAAQKIGQFVTDASYLYGLSRIYRALNPSWESEGSEFLAWLQQLGTGFLPYSNALRSIATAINPEVPARDLSTQEVFESIIPFLRKKIKKRLTVWGEPAKYVTGAPGTFLPVATSEITTDDTENELMRLDYSPGFPSKPSGMDDNSYRAYLVLSGRLSKLAVSYLIHQPAYYQADDNTKRKMIANTISAVRKQVRQQYFGYFKWYDYFYNLFRNQGFNRENSEAMADKAFDMLLQGVTP